MKNKTDLFKNGFNPDDLNQIAHEFADEITQLTYDEHTMATEAYIRGFLKAIELIQKEFSSK